MRLLDCSMGTISLSASGNSNSIDFKSHFGYCIVGVVTGASAAGTADLYISVDNTNFQIVPKSTITIAGAGTAAWEFSSTRHQYAQIRFTRTSGTGSMVLTVEGKGF